MHPLPTFLTTDAAPACAISTGAYHPVFPPFDSAKVRRSLITRNETALLPDARECLTVPLGKAPEQLDVRLSPFRLDAK